MSAFVEVLTLEEFMARPEREDGQREELLEGELIVSPAPKMPLSAIVMRLRHRLARLEEQQDFVIINDFACVLGTHSMPAPDLAVVRRQRMEAAERANAWLEGSPELVIEVWSPSNRRLAHKAAVYLDHGAEQVWVVYPKTRTVSVHTVERTSEARPGETLEFHGVTVAVDDIFPPP